MRGSNLWMARFFRNSTPLNNLGSLKRVYDNVRGVYDKLDHLQRFQLFIKVLDLIQIYFSKESFIFYLKQKHIVRALNKSAFVLYFAIQTVLWCINLKFTALAEMTLIHMLVIGWWILRQSFLQRRRWSFYFNQIWRLFVVLGGYLAHFIRFLYKESNVFSFL